MRRVTIQKSKPIYFEEDYLVWLKIQPSTKESKLDPKYKGPYPIIKTSGSTIHILEMEKDSTEVVKKHHFKNIKPYISNLYTYVILLFFSFLSFAASSSV